MPVHYTICTMPVRMMGQDTSRSMTSRFLGFFAEFFREYPEFVPQVAPDSEEPGGNKLSDIRSHTDDFQAINYKIIQYEINKGNDYVAAGDFGLVLGQLRIFENPVALQQIINRPAD